MNKKITLVIGIFFLLTIANIGSMSVTFGQAGVGSGISVKDESPHLEKNYGNCKFSNPVVNFTWEVIDCYTVLFTDTSNGGSFEDWTWDFTNDGTVDDWGKNVIHTYLNHGVYVVKHCVQGIFGHWYCCEKYVTIGYPIADFQWEADGLKVTFTDKSTDCDGEITYRGWDFTKDGFQDDYGTEVIHEYPESGTYAVYLLVQDNDAYSDSITKEVTVTRPVADLDCEGTLSWSKVKPGSTETGSFKVMNVGQPDSKLDWSVCNYPTWGTWTFIPPSGKDLKPGDESIIIAVTVTAPNQQNHRYTGQITICNDEDSNDKCTIQVFLATPKIKTVNNLFLRLLENHSCIFPILRQLLKLY